MRIAYLINQYPMTSLTFIRREIAALEGAGVEVRRFALRPWSEKMVSEEDQREAAKTRYVQRESKVRIVLGVLMMLVGSPGRFFAGLKLAMKCSLHSDRSVLRHVAYFVQACVLVRWLDEAEVEHMHVHFATSSGDIAMLCREMGGPRYSMTVHGPEEIDRATGLNYPQKIERAEFVSAISEFTRSQLCRRVRIGLWDRIHVVHCGLDGGYLARETEAVGDSRTLVCIGRLCEQKAQQLLVRAVNELKRRGVACRLVLVGDGEMRAEIEQIIREHGLEEWVTLLGWADTSVVQRWLRESRVMVLPSFAEGLPVVIMEALAMGRPVISTYIAGIPELVDHHCGWLVPAGALGELADAMEAALATPVERLREMGQEGRRRVLERHDIGRESAKLLALMQRSTQRNVAAASGTAAAQNS
jgi:glycosyltransferase involved in cell wall biosynthesis